MANKQTTKILKTIAEYRLLTVRQLTILHYSKDQATNRQLRSMEDNGLIKRYPLACSGKRGRPINVVTINHQGVEELKKADLPLLDDSIVFDRERQDRHQLLLNEFRIQLGKTIRNNLDLSARFLSSSSPFLSEETGISSLSERVPVQGKKKTVTFTPDAVFSVKSAEKGKSLLFFLEVDMSTESLSNRRGLGDIRHKVVNYRTYLGKKIYNRYQRLLKTDFNGFRLLFLVNTEKRSNAISRIVAEMLPSNFIWITDQERMSTHGLAGKIWVRGGQQSSKPQSILKS